MQTAQLKKAFIKAAHADNKHITLAIFVKELEDEIEVAQWIYDTYAVDYKPSIRMHMSNMIEAQLKLNAGSSAVMEELLKNVAEIAGMDATELKQRINSSVDVQDITAQAEQATKDLLGKLRLH